VIQNINSIKEQYKDCWLILTSVKRDKYLNIISAEVLFSSIDKNIALQHLSNYSIRVSLYYTGDSLEEIDFMNKFWIY